MTQEVMPVAFPEAIRVEISYCRGTGVKVLAHIADASDLVPFPPNLRVDVLVPSEKGE